MQIGIFLEWVQDDILHNLIRSYSIDLQLTIDHIYREMDIKLEVWLSC